MENPEEKGCWNFTLIVSVTAGVVILASSLFRRYGKMRLIDKKHVVITGGSSGIGKCAAIYAATLGADVTLVARDEKRLEAARLEVTKACKSLDQKVNCLSLDVSVDYEMIEKKLLALEDEIAPVYMLINCAGAAVCGRLEDTDPSDIKGQISLNLLGTIFPTKALISRMKSRREGIVVITGSQASLLGIYGLPIYSSTKFALRGLAEALCMETKPYNVSVTLALPPDTDTPGFANEEKTKPPETRLISESAGLLNPEVVGTQIVKDALAGRFFSYVGFESGLLCTLCVGMSPVSSFGSLLREIISMGLTRLIGVFYLFYFDYLIKKCRREQESSKKVA